MKGVRFRVPLTRSEVQTGKFYLGLAFKYFAKTDADPQDFRFDDASGKAIRTEIIQERIKEKSIFGQFDGLNYSQDLSDWYNAHNAGRHDSVIVTILDWGKSHYRLTFEKQRARIAQRPAIDKQNQAITDYIFEMLENETWEYISTQKVVPHAYYRFGRADQVSPDHWYPIIDDDPRMVFGIFHHDIRYAEWDAPIVRLTRSMEGTPHPQAKVWRMKVDRSQADQVYRFKAALKHRKRL
jgi:hypothetical protein